MISIRIPLEDKNNDTNEISLKRKEAQRHIWKRIETEQVRSKNGSTSRIDTIEEKWRKNVV